MKVLVIYKQTKLARAKDEISLDSFRATNPNLYKRWERSDATHQETLLRAKQACAELELDAVFCGYHDVPSDRSWDLVVTIGGDGTLLWASHFVSDETPIVGINSAPETSVGYFCAGDGFGTKATLRAAVEGKLHQTLLSRMSVSIGKQEVSRRVLNDVLYCHECPASTARYVIESRGQRERQMSSGVWIGPPAGSTAAMLSAGGSVLPIAEEKLQFVVREPYQRSKLELVNGVLEKQDSLRIHNSMVDGRLFLDGSQKVSDVPLGETVCFSISPEPLRLLGLRARR